MSELTFARILSFIITLLVTGNAFLVSGQMEGKTKTIIDLMPKFFNMFVGPLAALFMIGMFLPRCTARSVIPAVMAGFSLSVAWSWWVDIGKQLARVFQANGYQMTLYWELMFSKPPTPFLAIAAPCIATMAMAVLLSRIVEKKGDHPGMNYTWRAVTSRPELPTVVETA